MQHTLVCARKQTSFSWWFWKFGLQICAWFWGFLDIEHGINVSHNDGKSPTYLVWMIWDELSSRVQSHQNVRHCAAIYIRKCTKFTDKNMIWIMSIIVGGLDGFWHRSLISLFLSPCPLLWPSPNLLSSEVIDCARTRLIFLFVYSYVFPHYDHRFRYWFWYLLVVHHGYLLDTIWIELCFAAYL